jgi:UDP-N-acetylglucosamine--N-acetylmuramyl-(pentapeptide) pyrophosphoryl-undecaprenol N-acetylglucosamine transferase
MEARLVTSTKIAFAPIKAGKFRRDHFAKGLAKLANLSTFGPNVRDAFRTVAGVTGSLKVLRTFKPDVVFLYGGYVCLPVGLAAKLLHIPYIIHEADLNPGLTNRILSRWAVKIAVGFPVKNYRCFDDNLLVFTGNPVRAAILTAHRLEGLAAFKFNSSLPVLLILGGSQGAREINDVVIGALSELTQRYQIIHQTGDGEIGRVKFELSRRPKLTYPNRYRAAGFIMKEMPAALAAADLVIGRAGAGTIADSAVIGKPTVLIPNTTMAGHQVQNARMLSRAGAARVLDGPNLTPEQLVGEIDTIFRDPETLQQLGKGIMAFGRRSSAQDLAKLILATGREGTSRG